MSRDFQMATSKQPVTPTFTAEEQQVLERLENWIDRLDSLRVMVGRESGEMVQSAYARFHQDLIEESRSQPHSDSDQPLTSAEQRFYETPIRQAAAHLVAPANATTTKIDEALSKAHADLGAGIARLKTQRRQ